MSEVGITSQHVGQLNPVATSADAPWLVLASGDPRPAEPPVRPRRVIVQVAAAAAAVIVVVALLGSVAASRLAERQSVNDAAQRVELFAAILEPVLQDSLVTGDRAAIAAVDRVVRDQLLGRFITRVKIWSADGRVVYSDEPRLIGERFPLNAAQLDAMANPQTQAEVSVLDQSENKYERGLDKLLEVYRPVWTEPSGTTLLLETYSPYTEVGERSTQLWHGFAGLMVSSLLLLVVLLMPVLWRLLDRVRRGQAHREALLQRAVDASQAERQRIAGTLHDGVVQELAATSFALAGCIERAEREGATVLAGQLREASTLVRTSIGGLRSLLVDIYPPSLASAGLVATLEDRVGPLRSRDVTVRLDLPAAGAPIAAETERLIYRIAHECLTNVAKHSAATQVMVRLQRRHGDLVLDVVDDGVGFDPEAVLRTPTTGHFGLRVLRDLAQQAGATLAVSSTPGQGTWWQLRVGTS